MADGLSLPAVPQMKATLSYASPEKAAQIRSAVTGALRRDERSGLFCFEQTVETTFVLPWDISPRVAPLKLSEAVRDRIRSELLDAAALSYLEDRGAANWAPGVVKWECRAVVGGRGAGAGEWVLADHVIAVQLETSYYHSSPQATFAAGFLSLQVDHDSQRLLNTQSGQLFEIRRLGLAPLMPMKTEEDICSLFHATSIGLWGVHDRTSLLLQAVEHTLADPKAMFPIYDRWSLEVTKNASPGVKTEFPHWEAAKENLSEEPQLHIFTLSNVIQRPILVYGPEDCAVSGVYLPLLWEQPSGKFPCDQHPHLRNPLVLGYDASRKHFFPLVTFRGSRGPNPIMYPLVFSNGHNLPLHFLSEPQLQMDSLTLLSQLMFVDVISPPYSGLQALLLPPTSSLLLSPPPSSSLPPPLSSSLPPTIHPSL